MDVLAYSAFNENLRLADAKAAKEAELATKQAETNIQLGAVAAFSSQNLCWLTTVEPLLLKQMNVSCWCYIPGLPSDSGSGATNGLKVCNICPQFNCGECCLWTVPAGASKIRFQMWGAGGGSGAGCCCGGSVFGSTGAYASVMIPATPGCQYTVCSGCAYCCFPTTTTGSGRMPGCPSYVQGYGLENVCASGGQARMGEWMGMYGKANTYRMSHISHPDAGPCFCNTGADYCFHNSCATCGQIPYVPGADYYGTVDHPSSTGDMVHGIRGYWPSICFDTNNYGHQCHAPIYGFASSTCCSPSWTSGTCCGKNCSAGNGYMQVPGAGGFYSHMMGGSNGICGDMGRMGMVCISWE